MSLDRQKLQSLNTNDLPSHLLMPLSHYLVRPKIRITLLMIYSLSEITQSEFCIDGRIFVAGKRCF